MLERIDHVGIVVSDLKKSLRDFTSTLGIEGLEQAEVPSRGVQVARLAVGEGAVELIQPVSGEGRVAAFLREHGGGVHHVAFRVSDLSEIAAHLRERGVLPAAASGPQTGAFGRRVLELPSEAFAGVRIQLVM